MELSVCPSDNGAVGGDGDKAAAVVSALSGLLTELSNRAAGLAFFLCPALMDGWVHHHYVVSHRDEIPPQT